MRSKEATADVLDEALLREIARQGGIKTYPAHSMLINEGDSADSLFILLSGRVKVFSVSLDGREVVITTHGAGEYVGELALDGGVRSASVMTLEPTTCSIVSGASLRDFVASNPDFALHVIRKLIRSVREATESVKSLALEDVYARVVRLLGDLSDPTTEGRRQVREKLTQQAIADRVGASREMVSRIIKDLTRGGHLSIEDGRIVVLRKLPSAW
jgi:CRP/FNR family cyclic AMP-dependent transcriptional regulator